MFFSSSTTRIVFAVARAAPAAVASVMPTTVACGRGLQGTGSAHERARCEFSRVRTMDGVARRALCAAAVAAAVAVAPASRAASPSWIRLEWPVAAGCPGRDAVLARARAESEGAPHLDL